MSTSGHDLEEVTVKSEDVCRDDVSVNDSASNINSSQRSTRSSSSRIQSLKKRELARLEYENMQLLVRDEEESRLKEAELHRRKEELEFKALEKETMARREALENEEMARVTAMKMAQLDKEMADQKMAGERKAKLLIARTEMQKAAVEVEIEEHMSDSSSSVSSVHQKPVLWTPSQFTSSYPSYPQRDAQPTFREPANVGVSCYDTHHDKNDGSIIEPRRMVQTGDDSSRPLSGPVQSTPRNAEGCEVNQNKHYNTCSMMQTNDTTVYNPPPIDTPVIGHGGLSRQDGVMDTEPVQTKPCDCVNRAQGQDTFNTVTNAIRDILYLPKPTIMTFDNKATSYVRFMRNFKSNIAHKITDDTVKLNYLIQHTSGEAYELIADYVACDDGYNKALLALEDRFGNPHVITQKYVNQLINGAQLRSGDAVGLSQLAAQMEGCATTLQYIGYSTDLNTTDILLKIARRLPSNVRNSWLHISANIMQEQRREPSFDDLVKVVKKMAFEANTVYSQDAYSMTTERKTGSHKPKEKQTRVTTFATQSEKTVTGMCCYHCDSKKHYMAKCDGFQRLTLSEKKKRCIEKNLCFNCLRVDHDALRCPRPSFCRTDGCTKKTAHSNLMHASKSEKEESEVGGVCHSTRGHTHRRRVMLRVVPVLVRGSSGACVPTYALLDQCSDVTLCSRSLYDKLGVKGKKKSFTITTVNTEAEKMHGMELDLVVSSLEDTHRIQLSDVWSVDALPINSDVIPKIDNIRQWSHLEDVELSELDVDDVGLLIGGDVTEPFIEIDARHGKEGEPYAIKTALGWSVMGPSGARTHDQATVHFTRHGDILLEEQVERFWKTDFSDADGCHQEMSVEDQKAQKMMDDSIVMRNGHYEVALPWRQSPPPLSNNRVVAENRLQMLKKRLSRDHDLRRQYTDVIQGYISKGYARKLDTECSSKQVWYLPHHPVFHPQKKKVRVVFDGAAKYRGRSINDELLQGPPHTNSLVGILHRFRRHEVALAADIEAMYHQVKARDDDINMLRFLWWDNDDMSTDPIEYAMTAHVFGLTSSPSICCYALRYAADARSPEYDATTVATVHKNFYVDDLLTSVPDVEAAQKLSSELTDMMQKSGFHLTKWMSNNIDVLTNIPEGERAKSIINLDLDDLPIERTLGLGWNVETDSFQFTAIRNEKPATRRGILSVVSSLYDPLGFFSPVTLTVKLVLQELCKQQLKWDDPVNSAIKDSWDKWLNELVWLAGISIPRCFVPSNFGVVTEYELHYFADASSYGYGAVAYLRVINGDGCIHCAFIMGKARVAPVKAVTIPRLELSAAVVAAKLHILIQEELNLDVRRTVFWTDSTSVLFYINNEKTRYKTFVANRLATIHNITSPSQWRYVDTASNPADYASRGLMATQSDELKIWLEGPAFLWRSDEFPVQPLNLPRHEDGDIEIKATTLATVALTPDGTVTLEDVVARYSSWYRLKKAMAWLRRFTLYMCHKYLHRGCVNKGNLSVGEIEMASMDIIRYIQRINYSDELQALRKETHPPGTLQKLSPILKDGVIRVGGRLDRSTVDYDAKHQIILPQRCHISKLIIRHYHILLHHTGVDSVLAAVREKYWIVCGRAAVKSVIHQCTMCRKRSAPRGEQYMAPLPDARLSAEKPPFTHTGVDYFGPLIIKQGRAHVKRYGVLFTCMTMRAVHIEIAHTLDTNSFMAALQRFMARRGRPSAIYSDNGTNLRSGHREITEALRDFNQQKITDELRMREIEWHFNPPTGCHMGGCWESLVKSTKTVMRAILQEQLVNDECLLTVMAEVEKVLNDRPLTRVSSDSRDVCVLTPNALLLHKQNQCIPLALCNKKDDYTKKWWRQSQYLANVFWRRWLKEYLPTLQERRKWQKIRSNFQVGDIVLLVDENVPRGQWPLGRIVETRTDRAGHVRSCEVWSGNTRKVRPITKMCLLECSEEYK